MKRLLLILAALAALAALALPAFAQEASGPTRLIPRYYSLENAELFPEFRFFAVVWDPEPELTLIAGPDTRIGGRNTMSQAAFYYLKATGFDESLLREKLSDYREFHEIAGLGKFSYPVKLGFLEVPAFSDYAETTNSLRVRDLNLPGQTGPNRQYLILEDTRLAIGKTDGGEESRNLLLANAPSEKKRLPVGLAVFISVALPLAFLWLGLKGYHWLKNRQKGRPQSSS